MAGVVVRAFKRSPIKNKSLRLLGVIMGPCLYQDSLGLLLSKQQPASFVYVLHAIHRAQASVVTVAAKAGLHSNRIPKMAMAGGFDSHLQQAFGAFGLACHCRCNQTMPCLLWSV